MEFGNLIPGKCCFLEGNICNFEGKFIVKMDILVSFLQKNLKIGNKIHHIFDRIPVKCLHFFPAWEGTGENSSQFIECTLYLQIWC